MSKNTIDHYINTSAEFMATDNPVLASELMAAMSQIDNIESILENLYNFAPYEEDRGYSEWLLYGGFSTKNGFNCLRQIVTDPLRNCLRDYDPVYDICFDPIDNGTVGRMECVVEWCTQPYEARICKDSTWHSIQIDRGFASFDKFYIACLVISIFFLITILVIFNTQSRNVGNSPRLKIHCQLVSSLLLWYLSFSVHFYQNEVFRKLAEAKRHEFNNISLDKDYHLVFSGQYILNRPEPQEKLFVPVKYNSAYCMISSFLTYYFWLTTCGWSYVEAIQVLYSYYFSLSRHLNILYLCLIGWFCPLILMGCWGFCKMQTTFLSSTRSHCWPTGSKHCDWWFMSFPICFMLLIGLIAMIVLMVEVTRLNIRLKRSVSIIILKNVRSAISLIILFGASHLLTFVDDPRDANGNHSTLFYVKNIFEATQGAFVALFWGFFTNEFREFYCAAKRKMLARQNSELRSTSFATCVTEIRSADSPFYKFGQHRKEDSISQTSGPMMGRHDGPASCSPASRVSLIEIVEES